MCTRCAAGNWECVYGTRARRSLGRRAARAAGMDMNMDMARTLQRVNPAPPPPKKRKIRESIAPYVPPEPVVDLKAMARELELAVAEDNEPLVGMTDDQMVRDTL